MNTPTPRIPAPTLRPLLAVEAQSAVQTRREYRERDFGVGYGRSSGYAAQRQYVSAWNGQPRFRCG